MAVVVMETWHALWQLHRSGDDETTLPRERRAAPEPSPVRQGPVSVVAPRQAILVRDVRREGREHRMDIPGRPCAGEKAAEHRVEKAALRYR
jgi:hypothetical protein